MTPEQNEKLLELLPEKPLGGSRAAAFFIPEEDPLIVNPPPGWKRQEVREDGVSWINKKKRLFVIASIATESDKKQWLHVSCSHATRLPTYGEMAMVKRVFVGSDRYAISIMPPTKCHVNIHPNCLHWWSCLNGHPLPEFSFDGSI